MPAKHIIIFSASLSYIGLNIDHINHIHIDLSKAFDIFVTDIYNDDIVYIVNIINSFCQSIRSGNQNMNLRLSEIYT